MLIHFDKLRVSDDNKHLEIIIRVGDEKYFENVYLSELKIQDKETYNKVDVFYKKFPKTKLLSIDIPFTEILSNLNNNMLFISVGIEGTPGIECPCGADTLPTAVYVDTSNIIKNIE